MLAPPISDAADDVTPPISDAVEDVGGSVPMSREIDSIFEALSTVHCCAAEKGQAASTRHGKFAP